jgi:deoxyadenosine/deoxycytidine kinase
VNEQLPYPFIAIEGNIGAGKTTLATRLSEDYNTRLILEQFADNPFLPKFYAEPDKYSFPLELSFLAERYRQLKEELGRQDIFRPGLISDYFFLKSLIFARANLRDDEYELYTRLFHIINDSLPKPDLFVYLYRDIESLQINIRRRGRSYEQNISNEYLERIQSAYFDFIRQMPQQKVLIIDMKGLDFSADESAYRRVKELLHKSYNPGITRVSG